MRFLPASLLLLAISACQSVPPDRNDTPPAATDTTAADEGTNDRADEDPVELRTDRAQYRAGDRVGLTLVNHAEATFSFNPCTRTVEREADGGWVPVEEPGRACTMEAWLIEPGATRTADTELPDPLAAGRYRLVVALTGEGQTPPAEHTQAVSEPFTVVP